MGTLRMRALLCEVYIALNIQSTSNNFSGFPNYLRSFRPKRPIWGLWASGCPGLRPLVFGNSHAVRAVEDAKAARARYKTCKIRAAMLTVEASKILTLSSQTPDRVIASDTTKIPHKSIGSTFKSKYVSR